MIDSHIHLTNSAYNQSDNPDKSAYFPYIDLIRGECIVLPDGNRDKLIAEMKKRGITCCIEPATDFNSNKKLLDLCGEYEGYIYPAVGIHPKNCMISTAWDFERVTKYARNQRVIAIGETGLDYYYAENNLQIEKQKEWFQYQIDLADELHLPLILHIRSADDDGIKILRANRNKIHGGVCHCFCSGPDVARIYTSEFGLCLGIGGTLLIQSEESTLLQQAVIETPLQHVLLETDGPYRKPRKPDGISGKMWKKARNTPFILPAVAKKIAELKEIPVDDVIRITDENVRRVFGI